MIEQANVDLVAERAAVAYDPTKLDVPEILVTIRSTGYDVAVADAEMAVMGLHDASDSRRLEHQLLESQGDCFSYCESSERTGSYPIYSNCRHTTRDSGRYSRGRI